jgi:predicted transcriptional regulator
MLMNRNENASKGKNEPPEKLINEILNMDRLLYLKIIQEKESLSSLEMTREVLALKSKIKPEQVEDKKILKYNPNINKRLKYLSDLGILNDYNGQYSLTSIGFLLIEELPILKLNIGILKKHDWFFRNHDYTVIPTRLFREIHTLQFAEQCKDAIEYNTIIVENIGKTNLEIRIVTDRVHDIPSWIIEELKKGNLALKLVYYFRKPFQPNSDDENELKLWADLTEQYLPKAEFRYLTFKDKKPIEILIIDKEWALFNLYELAEDRLDRSISFYGAHEQFVDWVENIFSSIWDESKPLDSQSVTHP